MSWSSKEEIQAKKELARARATTWLTGDAKNRFFEDVIKSGKTESKLLQEIIRFYYEHKQARY